MMIIKKCPHCNNNVRIHPVKHPFINDYGGIILECTVCRTISNCDTVNPDDTYISEGAIVITTWDRDSATKEKIKQHYPGICDLIDGVIVVGDYQAREYKFNFDKPNIYFCSCCRREIETIALEALKVESARITSTYNTLMNYILANHRAEKENLIVEVRAKCICNQYFTSYWHKKFTSDHKQIIPEEDLFLIGTDMPVNSSDIDGIMSKDDCKTILEKFVIRWNAIFPKLLIVTPFVGHQWLSKEEIIELWEWMKNFLDPERSTLITRTATFNKYKKACEDVGISIDFLENYGLNNAIIQDYKKKQDFHAKIYVGYSSTNSEMLLGSFNLMNGPSAENISFKATDYNTLIGKFISPMNITIHSPESIEKEWLRIFKNDQHDWEGFHIDSSEILEKIMKYQ